MSLRSSCSLLFVFQLPGLRWCLSHALTPRFTADYVFPGVLSKAKIIFGCVFQERIQDEYFITIVAQTALGLGTTFCRDAPKPLRDTNLTDVLQTAWSKGLEKDATGTVKRSCHRHHPAMNPGRRPEGAVESLAPGSAWGVFCRHFLGLAKAPHVAMLPFFWSYAVRVPKTFSNFWRMVTQVLAAWVQALLRRQPNINESCSLKVARESVITCNYAKFHACPSLGTWVQRCNCNQCANLTWACFFTVGSLWILRKLDGNMQIQKLDDSKSVPKRLTSNSAHNPSWFKSCRNLQFLHHP